MFPLALLNPSSTPIPDADYYWSFDGTLDEHFGASQTVNGTVTLSTTNPPSGVATSAQFGAGFIQLSGTQVVIANKNFEFVFDLYITNTGDSRQGVFAKRSSSLANDWYIVIDKGSGNPKIQFGINDSLIVFQTTANLQYNTWQRVKIKRIATVLTIDIDATSESFTYSNEANNTGWPVIIGKLSSAFDTFLLNGKLSNLTVKLGANVT